MARLSDTACPCYSQSLRLLQGFSYAVLIVCDAVQTNMSYANTDALCVKQGRQHVQLGCRTRSSCCVVQDAVILRFDASALGGDHQAIKILSHGPLPVGGDLVTDSMLSMPQPIHAAAYVRQKTICIYNTCASYCYPQVLYWLQQASSCTTTLMLDMPLSIPKAGSSARTAYGKGCTSATSR
jgi:hypothetical protein